MAPLRSINGVRVLEGDFRGVWVALLRVACYTAKWSPIDGKRTCSGRIPNNNGTMQQHMAAPRCFRMKNIEATLAARKYMSILSSDFLGCVVAPCLL